MSFDELFSVSSLPLTVALSAPPPPGFCIAHLYGRRAVPIRRYSGPDEMEAQKVFFNDLKTFVLLDNRRTGQLGL